MFGTLGERYAGHCYEFTAPTKTFNIAGLLCSNVITVNPELKRAFDVAAENIAGLTVSHFGLVACQAAYERAEPWLDALMGVLADNLSLLREFAERTPGLRLIEPEGTYLAWLDCRGLGFGSGGRAARFHARPRSSVFRRGRAVRRERSRIRARQPRLPEGAA